MQQICVFCGSSLGSDPAYAQNAKRLGTYLAHAGLALVYGGGGVGLMGELADAVLDSGGRVIGVIPEALVDRELGHRRITELRVVGTMHQRKSLMAELSDAFIALPGGAGTLEEFCEIWTWAQLGIHAKPCGIVNVDGYFSTFLTFLDEMVAKGFLRREYRDLILVDPDPEALVERLRSYHPPVVPRWLPQDAT
jgi:uncharacterized protein (TIGR00730 family)